jgi:hypothetical protein
VKVGVAAVVKRGGRERKGAKEKDHTGDSKFKHEKCLLWDDLHLRYLESLKYILKCPEVDTLSQKQSSPK